MSDSTTLPLNSPSDTPRTAYGVLQLRATLATVAILFALAGIAWWSTIATAHDMGSMVQGLSSVGRAMPFDMSAFFFLSMWTTMMVAMMFPAVAPIVLLHRMVLRRRGESAGKTLFFGLGYLLVWAAVGVVPLGILIGFRHYANESQVLSRVGGIVLVVAGLYQFSKWKETCLKACRTPLSFVMTHDFGSGAYGP